MTIKETFYSNKNFYKKINDFYDLSSFNPPYYYNAEEIFLKQTVFFALLRIGELENNRQKLILITLNEDDFKFFKIVDTKRKDVLEIEFKNIFMEYYFKFRKFFNRIL